MFPASSLLSLCDGGMNLEKHWFRGREPRDFLFKEPISEVSYYTTTR